MKLILKYLTVQQNQAKNKGMKLLHIIQLFMSIV